MPPWSGLAQQAATPPVKIACCSVSKEQIDPLEHTATLHDGQLIFITGSHLVLSASPLQHGLTCQEQQSCTFSQRSAECCLPSCLQGWSRDPGSPSQPGLIWLPRKHYYYNEPTKYGHSSSTALIWKSIRKIQILLHLGDGKSYHGSLAFLTWPQWFPGNVVPPPQFSPTQQFVYSLCVRQKLTSDVHF